MPNPGFILIPCTTAKELWAKLSPENPLAPGPAEFIYRGQQDANWGLTPSVLRKDSAVRSFIPFGVLTSDMEIFGEMILLQKFVEYCDSSGLRVPADSIELRQSLDTNTSEGDLFMKFPNRWPSARLIYLMSLAQHHKIPTRLIDWSRRSHVAAYFAAADALTHGNSSELAVWTLRTDTLLKMQPDDASPIIGAPHPNIRLVTAPGSTSVNLSAQAGLFTLLKEHGNRGTALETRSLENEFKDSLEPFLWKLTLPVTQALDLLKLCEQYGITAATLFPGYDGAGAAVLLDASKVWPLPL